LLILLAINQSLFSGYLSLFDAEFSFVQHFFLFLCILQKPKPPPVEKAAAKPSAKAPAKKGKQQASTRVEEPDEPPLSPTSEKIRQQRYMLFSWPDELLTPCRELCTHPCDANSCLLNLHGLYRLVEEADFKSTTELFSKKGGDAKSLDTFIPKSESDFAEYAELIANKLRPYEVGLTSALLFLIIETAFPFVVDLTFVGFVFTEKLPLHGSS
jgi:hypothetical protein